MMAKIRQKGSQKNISNDPRSLEFDFSQIEPWKYMILTCIGQLLNERLKKGISQQELAKRMDVQQSVISRFEHAGRIPTFEFLYRVARALDLQLMITPYGDRTVALSQEQARTLQDMATPNAPDINSVIGQLIDNCRTDTSIDIPEETDEVVSEYIYQPQKYEDTPPLAAKPYRMEIS